MNRQPVIRIASIATLLFATACAVAAQGPELPIGNADVAFEILGRTAQNPDGTAQQFGYLSYLNGVDTAALFGAAPYNESTAHLTFFSDTRTVRVTNNDLLRVIERVGTIGIYLADTPNGTFTTPATFHSGERVMVGDLRHQVILNTSTLAFTATFVITIRGSRQFDLGGAPRRIGPAGATFRLQVSGHASSPAAAIIAGYAVK